MRCLLMSCWPCLVLTTTPWLLWYPLSAALQVAVQLAGLVVVWLLLQPAGPPEGLEQSSHSAERAASQQLCAAGAHRPQ
jgi:hypothetical protein